MCHQTSNNGNHHATSPTCCSTPHTILNIKTMLHACIKQYFWSKTNQKMMQKCDFSKSCGKFPKPKNEGGKRGGKGGKIAHSPYTWFFWGRFSCQKNGKLPRNWSLSHQPLGRLTRHLRQRVADGRDIKSFLWALGWIGLLEVAAKTRHCIRATKYTPQYILALHT